MISCYLEIDDGILYSDGYRIVNLKKPFRAVLKTYIRHEGAKYFIKKPSDSLGSLDVRGMSMYAFKVDEYKYASLHKTHSMDGYFKCHAIYETESSTPVALRRLSLVNLLDNVNSLQYNQFSSYFDVVFKYIVKSFNFSTIISDFEYNFEKFGLKSLSSCSWGVIGLGHGLNVFEDEDKLDGILPLQFCNSKLKHVNPKKHTNIDLSVLGRSRNIIVLSGMNKFSAGYITRYIRKIYPKKEVLPICIFTNILKK